MKRLAKYSLLLSLSVLAFSLEAQTDFFKKADQFFKKYVEEGRVDYKAIQNNTSDLATLLNTIENYKLKGKRKSHRKAFWINAYNIAVIQAVVDHYPMNSPMDQDGFFEKETYNVAGQSLTLNQIEKEKIFGQFSDPRVHFVLVCAAKGCPVIVPYAYKPSKLDQQLEQKTKETLNDPSFIRVKEGQNKVFVSEIFKWYKEEFTANNSSIIEYINQYREEKIPTNYSTDYYKYDWSLNDAKKNR